MRNIRIDFTIHDDVDIQDFLEEIGYTIERATLSDESIIEDSNVHGSYICFIEKETVEK